jgi:hypothetical protein
MKKLSLALFLLLLIIQGVAVSKSEDKTTVSYNNSIFPPEALFIKYIKSRYERYGSVLVKILGKQEISKNSYKVYISILRMNSGNDASIKSFPIIKLDTDLWIIDDDIILSQ